ncbi:MAG: restriction endonuclease subunit S [Brumimicrobium sp.]|nr:restriction endonuclease subunit S [Brumimicrobium sp.]
MKQQTKYKDTAVGKIPEDWEVNTFDEIFIFLRTNSFSRDNLTYDEINNEIFNIHYGDIHATFKEPILDFNKESNIPKVKDEFIEKIKISEDDYLRDGDLIIADASEDYEGLCDSVEIINIENRKAVSGLHTFAVRANKDVIAKGFNAYILRSQLLRKEFRRIATGISVFGVSKTNLSKLKLPIPPLPEQKAIANVLSTWDKAIEKHEQLIAQKELRKKGLMQRLLNEKFKEKNEKWEEVRLGEVISYENGKAHEQDIDENGNFIVVNSKFISTEGEVAKKTNAANCLAKKDDILMVLSDVPNGKAIAKCFYVETDNLYTVNQRICKLTAIKANSKFLFYIINRNPYFLAFDDGVKQTNLRKEEVLECSIQLPKIEEQNRIAQILQTADKEIQLLKEKTEWLREQKKGLMQVLLTGRKRLNYDLVD